MNDNYPHLIAGCNPYTITDIRTTRGYRLLSSERLHEYRRKKARGLWRYVPFTGGLGFPSSWIPACVVIRDNAGNVIKRIECRSNKAAAQLRHDLLDQLNRFVRDTKNG
jgi:hypothetical protein